VRYAHLSPLLQWAFFTLLNSVVKFVAKTLIDVTETGARKGTSEIKAVNQHQNFLTVLQTIGLRVNINVESSPKCSQESTKEFGSLYKGKHSVWTFEFEVEYQDALSIEILESDFDLVPVILGLDETAKINNSVFRTKDSKEKNIVFNIAV